jgi:hypothetical protein
MRVDLISPACSARSLEDTTVSHESGSSASAGIDKVFVIRAANILQALVCLNSLMRANAHDSGKVREHANLAEQKLQALGELMGPMLWSDL